MTVAELRTELQGLPDAMDVWVGYEGTSDSAIGAFVWPSDASRATNWGDPRGIQAGDPDQPVFLVWCR